MGLPGPSREIIYEPDEQPAQPERLPEPAPEKTPVPERAPARPREPEKVPA